MLLELPITQTWHPLFILDGKKTCLSSTYLKNEKKIMRCSHNVGAHLQYVYNHYAKFEYKGLNTVVVTEYSN